MASHFTFTVQGLPQVLAQLQTVVAQIRTQALDPALKDGAVQARGLARSHIRSRSGRLATSLNVKRLQPRPERLGYGVWSGLPSQLGLGVGAKWYYPAHLHLGHALPYQGRLSRGWLSRTRRGGRRRVGSLRRVAGRPYLRQVVTSGSGQIFQVVSAGIARRLASLTFP